MRNEGQVNEMEETLIEKKITEIIYCDICKETIYPKNRCECNHTQTDEKIICDGCNVRGSWEHRCHGSHSMIMGVQTNKPCECEKCEEMREIIP